MSAEVDPFLMAVEWQASPGQLGWPPSTELLHWLTYEGLLTVRLRQACPERFRLELLDRRTGPGLLVAEEPVRRVVLWCGNLPCVYAESHLPQQALAAVPGLRRLGNDPLGEALQCQPDVTRGPFEFAVLEDLALPVPLDCRAGQRYWARRSNFLVGDSHLTVAEVFLPAILALPEEPANRSES